MSRFLPARSWPRIGGSGSSARRIASRRVIAACAVAPTSTCSGSSTHFHRATTTIYAPSTTSTRSMASNAAQRDGPTGQIHFSQGTDPAAARVALEPLLSGAAGQQSAWQVTSTADGLQRTFRFKTFNKTWDFMNAVAAECKRQRHHPEWSNTYNTTIIRWTTHNPAGLSFKDLSMATFCDEQAALFGELPPPPPAPEAVSAPTEAKSILDQAAEEGSCACAGGSA